MDFVHLKHKQWSNKVSIIGQKQFRNRRRFFKTNNSVKKVVHFGDDTRTPKLIKRGLFKWKLWNACKIWNERRRNAQLVNVIKIYSCAFLLQSRTFRPTHFLLIRRAAFYKVDKSALSLHSKCFTPLSDQLQDYNGKRVNHSSPNKNITARLNWWHHKS